MAHVRFEALKMAQERKPLSVTEPAQRRSELFAVNVFNNAELRHYLSKEAFLAVSDAIQHGKKIDRKIADQVASAMKSWAISKGATHYTHWFQPLTGGTAEKHDAFFEPSREAIQHGIQLPLLLSWGQPYVYRQFLFPIPGKLSITKCHF